MILEWKQNGQSQNGEITKKQLFQNGDYFKTTTGTKMRNHNTETVTKRRKIIYYKYK